MKPADQIAKHLREFHFGGNWTDSNLKGQLEGVTWQQATTQVYSLHPIATLVYHMNYFVSAVLKVLQGGPLDAKDKFSFDCPPILSQEDWERRLNKTWTDAEDLASLIEQMPEDEIWTTFSDEKYGDYYRNLQGLVEHNHYHLGQIVMLKKIIQLNEKNEPL